ncbi:putative sulfate exporter family transporter [Streptomyces sp. NPDC054765]
MAIAVVATVVGRLFPIVGGPVTGIVLGVLLATVIKPAALLCPDIKTASKFLLQSAVVVLGSQLSLSQILQVGTGSLPVTPLPLRPTLTSPPTSTPGHKSG